MKRKLPPDSEVWALHASGLSRREIAERYGCTQYVVGEALKRWEDRPDTYRNAIKASTPDKTFVAAGSQPVAHRNTGEGANGVSLEMDGVFRRSFLELHECSDLLREWGIA